MTGRKSFVTGKFHFLPVIMTGINLWVISRLALVDELQKDISNVTSWTKKNNMIQNESKTKTMLVTSKRLRKKLDCSSLSVKTSDQNLEQVSSFIIGNYFWRRTELWQLCGHVVHEVSAKDWYFKKNQTFPPAQRASTLLQRYDKTINLVRIYYQVLYL